MLYSVEPKIPVPVVEKPSVLCSALVVEGVSSNSMAASVVVVVVVLFIVVGIVVVDVVLGVAVGLGLGLGVVEVVVVVVVVFVVLGVLVGDVVGLSVVFGGVGDVGEVGFGGRVLTTDEGRSGFGMIEVMLLIISLILVDTDIMVLVAGTDVVKAKKYMFKEIVLVN